jgi:hemerythrin-like domain-containing protein
VWSGAAVSIASPTVDAREVTATENLMRGQGVIRRALLVYSETAPLLRSQPASVDPAALYQTAQLFRRFGQDYHERMLEEDFVFPIVRILGGRAGKYPDVLEAQHRRGREITDWILRVTKNGRIGAGQTEPMAAAMEGLSRMYEHHAAREHTIVFPAWRSTMTGRQLDEMSGMFEEIGQREFGRNGFAEAERTMDEIEERLGLSDISRFTAPQINANKRGDCGAGL